MFFVCCGWLSSFVVVRCLSYVRVVVRCCSFCVVIRHCWVLFVGVRCLLLFVVFWVLLFVVCRLLMRFLLFVGGVLCVVFVFVCYV